MAKEERRAEILQAAGKVFYLKGFEKTKIEDIAKEAGIGKGTVYEYFESKQQLFDEMIIYNTNLYISGVERVLDSGSTLREKFLGLAKYQTQLTKDHLHIFSSMSCSKIMAREMGAYMLEQNIKVESMLRKQVDESIARDEVRTGIDAETVAAMMLGTINQYFSKKVIFNNAEPEELDYEKVADMIFHGISDNNSV